MNADVEATLERALAAKTRDEAWALLSPLRAAIVTDRDVAEAWLTLLAASPTRAHAVDDAVLALDSHTDDAITLLGLAVLIAVADLVPFDEPRAKDDVAYVAVARARTALARSPSSAALHAALGNALVRLGPPSDAEAIEKLEAAVRIEPRGEWLSDLGVLHKRARRFRAALTAFERARSKLGDARPLLFHIALCAIATGEHAVARDALSKLGFRVEGADRPLVPDLPETRIRLSTLGTGHTGFATVPDEAAGFERAWIQPLSPVHGVVRTPTHREAIADFGDVVLVDPAPVAFVNEDGARRPVLGVLAMLAPGDERRFRFLALEQREGQTATFGAALPEGCTFYLHGTRIEQLCPRCAAGETLTKHEHLPAEEHRATFGKIIVPAAVSLTDVRDAIDRARGASPGVLFSIPTLHEALGETAAAGKAHKAWGVIERGLAARRTL
jgi:hypothetical protein